MANSNKYQTIADNQVRQALINAGQDPDGYLRLKQEYADHVAVQNLQKEYDTWKSKHTKKASSSSKASTASEPAKFMTAEERKAYKEQTTIKQPLSGIDQEKSYANTYGKKRQEGKLREKEVAARNEARAIMRGETPSSTTDELPVLQKFTDRTLRGNNLDEYTNAQVAKAEREKEARQKALENPFYEQPKQNVGLSLYGENTVNELSMPQYQPRKTVQEETAPDTRTTQEKIADWLSPDYVLSEAEKEEARQIAQAELEKYNYRSGHIPVIQSNEDRVNYANMVNLLNKTSKVANTMQGFLDPYYNLARYASDAVNAVRQKIAPSEEAQATKDYVDNAYNLARQNAKAQDPNLYAGGQLAGNLSAYALTNPVFDAAGALAGANAAGRFALNQVGQAGQDVALDIIPTYREMMEDGVLSEEEKGELIKRFGADVVANLAMGSIPYLGSANYDYLAKTVGNNADIFKNMDATGAIRNAPDLIRETADAVREAEQLRQPIPSLNTAEDITNDINRQFTDAMNRYNSEFKDTSAMKNIYNADDLEGSMNNQLSAAMRKNKVKDYTDPVDKALADPKTFYTHTADEIKNMEDYVASTDQRILKYVDDVLSDPQKYHKELEIEPNTERAISDINRLTGIDTTGNKTVIDKDAVIHIKDKHGVSGKSDQSMADANSLARMNYIREKYDEMFLGKLNKKYRLANGDKAPTVVYVKKIDGQFYAIEAVTDAKTKTNHIVSTFIGDADSIERNIKKGSIRRVEDIANATPSHTSKNGAGSTSFVNSNITDGSTGVNKNTVNTLEIPSDTFNKIDSEAIELARPINEVQRSGIMDNVTDEKALLEWAKLNEAYSDYVMKAQFGDSVEEVEAAKKVLDNTRKRYARAMQNIDPEVSKSFNSGSYGNTIGRPLHERNKLIKSQRDAEDTANLILQNEAELNGQKPDGINLQYFAGDNGNEPKWKTSEAYTNTGKRGGGWTEAEYTKYTDPKYYQYETIDEVRSIEEATQMRLAEGREAFKKRVMASERLSSIELDGLMMEWRELTEEARALEAAGQNADKLWWESNKIFSVIQDQTTSNAQALQALAKWSRNTPEGMLVNAENIINGKTKVDKSAMQKQLDKFTKNNKKVQFTPEFEKEFLKEAEKLQGLKGTDLDTREAKEIMAKLGRMINEQIPVKFGEKLTTWLMDNMLGNFRTLISRNAGGNVGLNAMEQIAQRPLAAAIDSAVSLKTGKRTQAGLSAAGLAEYFQGFKKGLADELSDVKSGLHTARSGENTLENAISSNRRIFKSKLLNLKDQLTRHGLSIGDRPFYESVYNQTLGDYQRLYDKGLMGEAIQKLKPEEFKEYSEVAAHLNALGAVYQQDSTLSKALLGFKKDVGELSRGALGVDILSQFSMPFVKTPANVIERAIDYSPLGLVRNTFRTGRELKGGNFDQNRFSNELSRNILGTALMGGGVGLAANGTLSGSYSDDKDAKQAQKESGMQQYAWNVPEGVPGIGGMQMDISWVPVLGSNLVSSAAAYDAYNKGEGDTVGNIAKGLAAGGESLFDQSMFQGLQRLFGAGDSYNSDEGIVGNMANTVKSGLSQAIPSLVRQGAQVKDPYQRDLAYSNEGTSFGLMDNYDINSLANNVPILREEYLAPKVDTQGNLMMENQGRSLPYKILEDMILPGKLTEIKSNPLAEEAQRLSEANSSDKAYLPKADRKSVDTEATEEGSGHVLSNEEWVDYQQKYYKALNDAGSKLIDSEYYKGLDDLAKEEILSNTYSAIRSAVNSEYTGKELTGASKAYKEAGGGEAGTKAVINYYTAKNYIDAAGTTMSSKAGESIKAAVDRNDYQAAERLAYKEAKYQDALDSIGIEGSSATRKAYDEGGSAGLKKYAQYKTTLDKYGLDNTEANRKFLDEYGEKGLKEKQIFDSYGSNAKDAYTRYTNAKTVIPGLSASQFKSTYDSIDKMEKSDGYVSQKEMLSYLNSGNYSQEQANQLWDAYGNEWKKSVAKNKKGQWATVK